MHAILQVVQGWRELDIELFLMISAFGFFRRRLGAVIVRLALPAFICSWNDNSVLLWRSRGAKSEFEAGDLGLLCIFFSSLTVVTDEVKVIPLGFWLRYAKACAVLPDIAFLTGYAMRAIILKPCQ